MNNYYNDEDATQDENISTTKDSNGTLLQNGDNIALIKDLKIQGGKLKRGDVARNISLYPNDNTIVDGRINKVEMVLKTEYFKKV